MKYLVYAMLMIKLVSPTQAGIENTFTETRAVRLLNIEQGDSFSRCVFGISEGNGYAVMYNPCAK